MIRHLPTYHGYTVDVRLREFRRARWTKNGNPGRLIIIPFDSPRGDRMCVAYMNSMSPHSPRFKELAAALI